MTIGKRFRDVERKFVISIVLLAGLSVLALGIILYEFNSIRFGSSVSSSQLSSLVSQDPAVSEYLQQEKDYEAHFITIANMVKQDQQQSLGRALLVLTVPVLVLSGLAAYTVAKYLLKPVKDAYESQERFMQDAAHELRNPLAAISIALSNADKNTQATGLFKTISRQTKRLVNIVEDMLFLERRNSGDKIQDVDLSLLLSDVVEDLMPAIIAAQLSLKTNIQPEIIAKIDPQDFIKLSRNLIENAIKYSKRGGKINLDLIKSDKIRLTVTDKGIGIPPEDLANIGQRFYRAKNVARVPGTGLGIAIVTKILNSYGGKLTIESQQNKGTKVAAII